ncbi:MAG TPA: hypothetical protein VM913_07635 [Sphingomicrobium sp.]|jgi:hypothetical protein|nr:hypothetical protein [Sphingomicrobium sp.]
MRFKLVIATAASLGLAACGDRQDSAGNGIAADEGFSVENSAANDVTAIDAATADSAGMAADAEANLAFTNLGNEEDGNAPATLTSNGE